MKKNICFLVIFYLILTAVPSIFFTLSSSSSNIIYYLGGILGIASFVLLNFELLLVSRNKFIDRHFGLDRIYRYHMYIAVLGIILGFVHKLMQGTMYRDSFQTSLGDDSLVIFICIGIFSMLLMINKLFFKIKIIDFLRKILNKYLSFLKYQYKVLIHNILVIALIILLLHVLLASAVQYDLPLLIILTIYFIVPFILYLKRKIYDVYFNKKSKYQVSEIIKESGNIVTVKLASKYGKVFDYQPGQFLYVKIKDKNITSDQHPFTISSSPAQKDFISFTAKELGDYTNNLKNVSVSSEAIISGPYGIFSYKHHKSLGKLCFIAGGIGITPFLSMIRFMQKEDKLKEVVLLLGVSKTDELICFNELQRAAKEMTNLKIIPIVSGDDSYSGEKGFIDTEKIKKYLPILTEYDFYICGPPVMLDLEIKNLKGLGVSKDRIHFERFSM